MPPDDVTTTAPAPEATGQLFTLATRPRHQWGPQHRVAASDSLSGHEQFEWHCIACHLVRITVCPRKGEGEPRREYRWGGVPEQFEAQREPVCVPVVHVPVNRRRIDYQLNLKKKGERAR